MWRPKGSYPLVTNKNQHFVPRCYLRPFSHGEKGKSIRLFNIDSERLVENAAVKHQCTGAYFYGDDEKLEAAIQFMEQAYASTLRRVREPSYRKLLPKDALVLKRFWLLQYIRTEAASKRAVEMNNQLGELVGADTSFRLEIREAVLIAMHTFADQMQAIDDLRPCLVKNSTNRPFITSDDPAVLTNKWFKSDQKHRRQSFGLGTAGVLAVLPLSENAMFIAYDKDVYAISKNAGIASTKRLDDVRALNQLQFLACRANIYPGVANCPQALSEEFRASKNNRLADRHVLHYSVLDRVEGEYKRYRVVDGPDAEDHREALVHSQILFPNPSVWPVFLGWRRKGFGMANGTGVGVVRQSQTIGHRGPLFEKWYTGH